MYAVASEDPRAFITCAALTFDSTGRILETWDRGIWPCVDRSAKSAFHAYGGAVRSVLIQVM